MRSRKNKSDQVERITAEKKDLPFVLSAVAVAGVTVFMYWREGTGIPGLLLTISILFLIILVYKVLQVLFWKIEISESTVTFTSSIGRERVFPRDHIKWGLWKPALSHVSHAVL